MGAMRRVAVLLMAAGMSVVAGCAGGYTAEMYLRPEGVAWPAESKLITEVRIKGDEDVVGVVEKVAGDLGLKPDTRSTQRWWVKRGEEQFSINLGRMKS